MSEPLDPRLAALRGDSAPPPPPSDELLQAIEGMEPAGPRRPVRDWLVLVAVSLVYAGGLVALSGLRRDLGGLPLPWLVSYSAAWLIGFLAVGWWALVPERGESLLRWRRAGVAAGAIALGFIAAGLLFAEHVTGSSTMYEASPQEVMAHAGGCVQFGLFAALGPAALATFFLRGAVPVRSRWVAAAVGAAGGSLGGLVLHLYCPIGERFHLGLVHGGVVLLAAIASAVLTPRITRP